MVTEPEIAGTLQAEPDPRAPWKRLVALANENGGADNVTVLVIRMDRKKRLVFVVAPRGAEKCGQQRLRRRIVKWRNSL